MQASKMAKVLCDTAEPEICDSQHHNVAAEIHDLPNEVLEHIFCFLSIKERFKTELVCRRWREIGKTLKWSKPTELDVRVLKARWSKITVLEINANFLSPLLSRCGTSLKKLELNCRYQISSKVFNLIAETCPNLAEIRLWLLEWPKEDSLISNSLVNLARRCKNLKNLYVRYADNFDNMKFTSFLKQCQSLKCLVITDSTMTEECLDAVNEKLKCLHISRCKGMNIGLAAEKLIERCDCIEELCLGGYGQSLDASLIVKLLQYYKNTLQILYLECCKLKPEEWYGISHLLQHLEVLSLSGSDGIDVKFMKMLAEKCSKLRAVDLSDMIISDIEVSALASAPSLKVLNLSGTGVNGEGIREIASQGRLERLYLKHMSPCNSLLEESCISIAKSCSKVLLLDLGFNSDITDRLVDEFSSSLEEGFLKGPVLLRLGGTKVNETVKVCNKLKLNFKTGRLIDFQEISHTGDIHFFLRHDETHIF